MPGKIKILYIDDEPNNLTGFKASFRIDYQVFTALDTTEAEIILEKHPDIHVIFCDQRMPVKTGVEFFGEMRSRFPLPVRILLTAYTDIESVIDAINHGHIFRYVKKPWNDADIMSAIEEANKFYISNSLLTVKNEELKIAYNELDKFAYSVSHDIRGPLSGILGAINVAANLNSVTEMKEMLALMEKSVKKLDVFILSMHDYYTLQRGELQLTEIDMNYLVAGMQDMYKVYANAHQISFTAEVNQQEPFRCDAFILKLILNNLLSNAFKYQRKELDNKRVALRIEVSRGTATFWVADNGIGIPRHHTEEIFTLFFRATSQEAGSGFGLYNVKDALIKLNGDIKVDSVLGEGTTFTITIPNK
ncbi:hybrid sensor histidine kinase/response regulator [Hufsiella ginkgonis]|uniref:histidine kinase n=1 Tax=Hufsiella ginkgonis TaxID=2695274 RepID=A0A7K1XTN6_9SPHI|nr:hybrid sensor histidine kinase/response regulator [Hufsiella ginkgonis]MXV14381.1 response regulator [Hufsiella ginkgonis]